MRYRVLGDLELRQGRRWATLGAAQRRTLLAVLLCGGGQATSTTRLMDELWENDPPASAEKMIQAYVSRLRRSLGDESGMTLVTLKNGYRTHAYRLLVAPNDLDAHRFERLSEQGQRMLRQCDFAGAVDSFSAALELWRGPAFADVPPTPAVVAEAARLDEARLRATEGCLEALVRDGRHSEALPELESLAALHPLREQLSGWLMVALYRKGRQADALAVYRRLRMMLTDDLGIDPSPQLQLLHQQILQADPALLGAAAVIGG
ncbi:MAG: AfsR/SARP family transcriptional regulator [Catenulispora sp.]|nr:AfsR/SARP family transcriptional regulator [Catenulispora sp.]